MTLWDGMTGMEDVSLTQLISDVKEEKVEEIEVVGNKLLVDYTDSNEAKVVFKESDESLTATLKASEIDPSSVNIVVSDQTGGQVWFELLSIILPVLIVGGIFFMMMRQARVIQSRI